MGIDVDSWRLRIGCSGNLLNAISIRKGKLRQTLHDIKMTEYRRRTKGALFWIGFLLVMTMAVTSLRSGNTLKHLWYSLVIDKLNNYLMEYFIYCKAT